MARPEQMACDMLVLGGGMAGMTAAARAAERGRNVIVVEKAPEIGGSAALSGGYLWTLPTSRKLAYVDDGDPGLGSVVTDTYKEVLAWMRKSGIEMSPPQRVLYGRGYQIDMAGYLDHCARAVEAAGGHVVTATETLHLLTEAAAVVGAHTRHKDGDIEVRSQWTLLATGGFQGSPDLRAELVHPNARNIPLRSNPVSSGDGMRLALAVGAAHAGPNCGFYGHLVCCPVRFDNPSQFVALTQYHSDFGVLLNLAGRRYVDESRVDHASSQITVREAGARALLVWDERIQREHVLKPFVKGAVPYDKLQLALENGASALKARHLADIVEFAQSLGFDGGQCLATLEDYNDAVRHAPERLTPPRSEDWVAIEEAPFYFLQVQPAITFGYSGLRVDRSARALDTAGRPVPGLLVAGADAGNIYRDGYGGGLALAATFGYRAAATATGEPLS